MKIVDYPEATSLSPNDVLLIDGPNGTKQIKSGSLSKALATVNVLDIRLTISHTSWLSSGTYYKSTVSCPELTSADSPTIIDVATESSDNFSVLESILEAWSTVYKVTVRNSQIDIYSTELPEVDIPVHLTVIQSVKG